MLTEAQKRDLANILHVAWGGYTELLGEPPHGTIPQLNALVELMRLDDFVRGIGNKAVAKFYAEGQGKEAAPEGAEGARG